MAIRRDIRVTGKGFQAPIHIAYGTDLIPIEFFITDFRIPDGAVAQAYSIGKSAKTKKQPCEITDGVISFTPKVGFFEVGKNALQILVTTDEGELCTFTNEVECEKSLAKEGSEEIETQPSLVDMLLNLKIDFTGKQWETPGEAVREITQMLYEEKLNNSGYAPFQNIQTDKNGKVVAEDLEFYDASYSYETDGTEETIEYGEFKYIRVSGENLTLEELIEATIFPKSSEYIIKADDITVNSDGSFVLNAIGDVSLVSGFFVGITGETDGIPTLNGIACEKGIYFLSDDTWGIYKISKEIIKKIDSKFLPPSAGGGVSSWNELTDKPFYEVEEDVVAKADFNFVYNSTYGAHAWMSNTDTIHFELVENEKYFVEWDGTTHECTGITGSFNDIPVVGIGNYAVLGLDEDNDIPFAIVYLTSNGGNSMFTKETDASHKIRIYKEEVQTLDIKYIPDELYTQIDARIDAYIEEALGGEY